MNRKVTVITLVFKGPEGKYFRSLVAEEQLGVLEIDALSCIIKQFFAEHPEEGYTLVDYFAESTTMKSCVSEAWVRENKITDSIKEIREIAEKDWKYWADQCCLSEKARAERWKQIDILLNACKLKPVADLDSASDYWAVETDEGVYHLIENLWLMER